MSNCNKSTTLPTGPKGVDGVGQDGQPGGIVGKWTFSASTIVSPISTEIRFNNTSSTLVTEIYVSDTGRSSVDYDELLDSFDNSGNFGSITIYQEFDSTKFWIGKITSVTDDGTYHTLGVTYTAASDATIPTNIFSATANINLTFCPGAINGTNGVTGPAGLVLLNNGVAVETPINGGYPAAYSNFSSDKQYTLASANGTPTLALENAGDRIELESLWISTNEAGFYRSGRMTFGGVSIGGFTTPTVNIDRFKLNITITRQTSTTLHVQIDYDLRVGSALKYSHIAYLTNRTVPNMDTNSNDIICQGLTGGTTDGVSCLQFSVKLYKI